MFGRIISVVIAAMLAFVPVGARADVQTKTVVLTVGVKTASVQGNQIQLMTEPIITANKTYNLLPEESRFMMSIVDFSSIVGASIIYNPSDKTMDISFCSKSIKIGVGSTTAFVDGAARDVEIGLIIENGRTFIPVKVIAELSGGSATYDDSKKQMAAEFPFCFFTASEDTVLNTFAKVQKVDAGKITIVDSKSRLIEFKTSDETSNVKPGDVIRTVLKSTGDSWKLYHLAKENIEFDKGYLSILPEKRLIITNGVSTQLSYGFRWVDGKSYINITDLATIIYGYVFPGDMTAGQVKIYRSSKTYIFSIDKDFWFDSEKPETLVHMDGKTILQDGIVIVPVSALNTINGGEIKVSKDQSRIDLTLDTMPQISTMKSYSIKINSVDCLKNTIEANDYSMGPIMISVIDGKKMDCSQLEAGGYYTAVMEQVTDLDGNSKFFMTSCLKGYSYIFTYLDEPGIVTGKIKYIVDGQMAQILFDGEKDVRTVNLFFTGVYKAGMCIRGLLQYDYKGNLSMGNCCMVDCEKADPCQYISVVLSKKDGVIQGTDDAGKLWRINFPKVAWDLDSKLEDGQRYLIRGFQRGVVIEAIDYEKTDTLNYVDKKIPLVPEPKSKNSLLSFAFRYGDKTYVSLNLLGFFPLTYKLPMIRNIDELGNVVEVNIGSKSFKFNGTSLEFKTEPLYIGAATYIDLDDMAKIAPHKIVSVDKETLNIRIFSRNYYQQASEIAFCATVDKVDVDKMTANATDEFKRKVSFLFLDKNDVSTLKPGMCYNFSGKNYGWTEFVVFDTPAPADCPCGGGQTTHEVILGTIKSVDCDKREITVEDKDGNAFRCILPRSSKDCSLLQAGQNVGIEAEKIGTNSYQILYKWHFNKLPEPMVRKVTLRVGEKTATVENEKDIYLGYPIKMVNGEPCISKYALSRLFPSSVRVMQMDGRYRISIWGHVINFWIGQNEAIIDGVVTKIPVPMGFYEGQIVIPLSTIFSTIGLVFAVTDDGKTIVAEMKYCPIPLEATASISEEPFDSILAVNGVELTGGSLDMLYKIRVSDLTQLKDIKPGSCIKGIFRSFWLFDKLELFAQSIEPIECPQP